jgi:fused signal recognition particle receptor
MFKTILANLDAGVEAVAPVTVAQLGTGDYLVYGVGALMLVLFFAMALRQGAKKASKPTDPTPQMPETNSPSPPRKTFDIPQVLVGEDTGHKVRLLEGQDPKPSTTEAPGSKVSEAPDVEVVPQEPLRIEQAGKTLRDGLSKTKTGFIGRLSGVFGGRKTLDDDLLGELEEVLFTADIGVKTSQRLVEKVETALAGKALADPETVWAFLKDEVRSILVQDVQPLDFNRGKPFVIMVVGVNGVGKITTIGKLASQFKSQGHSVMLAAGDTFRAAAVEQLEVWGQRVDAPVVRGRDKQDPASVLFEAVERASSEGIDIVLADTAGRLQAKKGLMDELQKVHRVLGKAADGAPHEVWLVLDSTNGQNAISQAKEFMATVDVSGLILTKLDGTAKGGVAIGISDEMKLPIRYIGIGEGVQDLQKFDAAVFAQALLGEADA